MAVWLLRGLCNEVSGKTTAGFNRNWMGSMTSHLKIKGRGEKAWYRFAGCKKLLTACGKLQLPDHRVYSESCFYVHHKCCFLGWSSNKVHPKLLFAVMEMLLPFWDDTLKNLNSSCGKAGSNKKMSRLTDIRLEARSNPYFCFQETDVSQLLFKIKQEFCSLTRQNF